MLTIEMTTEMIVKILKKYINKEIKAEDIDEYVLIPCEFEQKAFEEAVKKWGVLAEGDSILVLCKENEAGDIVVSEHDEDLKEIDYYQLKWYRLYHEWDGRYCVEFSDY